MQDFNGLPKEIRQTTQDIAKGVTNAFIDRSSNKIKELANRFLNHELLFIQDSETIELVKQQIKTQEWALIKKYVSNSDHKLLIQMGLALRQLELKGDSEKINNLREKIHGKYKAEGLHISQFVQCKLIMVYVMRIVDDCKTEDELTKRIVDMLNNLENRVTFIQGGQSVDFVIEQIKTRLNSHNPEYYLIFSRDSVLEKGYEVKKYFEYNSDDIQYDVEFSTTKNTLIVILNKRDAIDL